MGRQLAKPACKGLKGYSRRQEPTGWPHHWLHIVQTELSVSWLLCCAMGQPAAGGTSPLAGRPCRHKVRAEE